MARLQLASLPPELLGQIVSHINPADKPSLAHLALASRPFHALATPALYHTVKVGQPMGDTNVVPNQFIFFLRTILSSPEILAPLVRRFHVEGPPYIKDPGPFLAIVGARRRPDDPVVRAWEAVVSIHEEEDRVQGNVVNWGQYISVLMALLLPRVTALRTIGFCSIGSDDGLEVLREIVDRLAPDAASAPPFWRELEEVEMDGGWDKYPPSLLAVAHLAARYPSVKRIYSAGYVDLDGGELLGGDYRLLKPASSSLESLTLGPCSQLHHDHLDALLRAPRALRKFHYNVGHTWAWIPFRTESLQKSIEHQKASLRELSITHSYYNFGPDNEDDVVGPMSFAACTALRVLEVSLPYVFGEDVVCLEEGTVRRRADEGDPSEAQQRACAARVREILPASIETVRFAQCGDGWAAQLLDRALLEVLAVQAEAFPRLRTIEVHLHESYRVDMEHEDMVDVVETSFRAGRAAGLTMELVEGGRLGCDDVDALLYDSDASRTGR
ncbi:hypothetical protein PG993_004070 [Apiospora rasikravindrae]|uniref:F-box domain-containing protein n=1 Tax=Apiospora rasikravindrae TaxID=990691 RepID=A0ABR1TDG6_9PEZI